MAASITVSSSSTASKEGSAGGIFFFLMFDLFVSDVEEQKRSKNLFQKEKFCSSCEFVSSYLWNEHICKFKK
jgi:hypothetical protein